MDAFWAGPPVTRTLAASIFGLSIGVLVGLIPGRLLIFHYSYIFRLLPQIWRLPTSFCLTSGLSIIFTPYLVWTNGTQLERGSPRFNSASFLVYLCFVGFVIAVLVQFFFGSVVFTSPLLLAIVYTVAQENRGQQVSIMIMQLDIKYFPYALLLFTLIQAGPFAALEEAMGIVAAHLYDFLTKYWPEASGGSSWIPTPRFVTRLFTPLNTPAINEKTYGTAIRPRVYAEGSGSGMNSSNAWSNRGQGHRLGGD